MSSEDVGREFTCHTAPGCSLVLLRAAWPPHNACAIDRHPQQTHHQNKCASYCRYAIRPPRPGEVGGRGGSGGGGTGRNDPARRHKRQLQQPAEPTMSAFGTQASTPEGTSPSHLSSAHVHQLCGQLSRALWSRCDTVLTTASHCRSFISAPSACGETCATLFLH